MGRGREWEWEDELMLYDGGGQTANGHGTRRCKIPSFKSSCSVDGSWGNPRRAVRRPTPMA